MNRITSLCLAVVCSCFILTAGAAGPLTTDAELFDALNLDCPGMEKVREDVGKGDLEAAKHSFAAYLRTRSNVKWLFDWKAFGSEEARNVTYSADADKYASNLLLSCAFWHQFGERVDWSANPTPQNYAEWTWQLSRHPFWIEMGKAYWATGDEKYAKAFVSQMRSWVEDDPCPDHADNVVGSRWRTIEAGIRMLEAWPSAFFYFIHSPNFDDEAVVMMVKSFYEHGKYLRRFHMANNWLTMEMDGLFHVGTVFPEFKQAREWQDYAAGRLYEEEKVQFYPDGAQKELAPAYQQVAMYNIMKIVRISQLNAYSLPEDFLARLVRAYECLLKTMSPSGMMPGVNDSDFKSCNEVLMEAWTLFQERKDFLFGATLGAEGTEPDFKSVWMPWAGWYSMRTGWNPKEDIYSFFEVGPYSEGHSHEDKLSFTVEAYGDRVITEGSIYPYDKSKWRKYVLSARAHNVSRVDGKDQMRGSLDSKKHPEVCTSFSEMPNRFIETPECVFSEGWYDEGFGSRNDSTVTQYRALAMVNSAYWILVDVFTPSDPAEHSYDTFFHFNTPDYRMMKDFVGVESAASDRANAAIVRLDAKCRDLKVVCGQEEPEVQGWIPHGIWDEDYYKCHPVATSIFSRKASGQVVEAYLIVPMRKGAGDSGLKKIKSVSSTEYLISFADGRRDRISFSFSDGSLKTFSVNGKNIIETKPRL